MAPPITLPHSYTHRFLWAGYLIGFALGGFFDGILLHQILQWHHLLSGVEADSLRDLRIQILADGVFHALMYVLGAVGLWLLYRSRTEFTGSGADRNLIADALVGFGAWHAVDAVFSHWLTGIHRIRMDVANPLLWDLGWLALFGLVPLAIGLWMKRRYPRQVSIADRRTGARGAIAFLGGLTLAAGWWAALPPAGTQDSRTTTVVLRPGMPAARLLSAMGDNTRILWSDPAGSVWVLARDDAASPLHYYRHGALYVSGSVLPAGCSGWIRT